MRWIKQKHTRAIVRSFWGSIILLVLVVAVGVQLGREAFPMLNDYRESISEHISDVLDVEVDIGAIEARWIGLRPQLEFTQVSVRATDGQKILDVGKIEGEISLISSLREWQLVWRRLNFRGLDMQFDQSENGRWSLGGLSLAQTGVTDPSVIKDPLDIFLLGRHITLNDSNLQFAFRTGHEAQLTVPELVLENEADFHRLTANFAVDEDDEAFALIIEGYGNPRVEQNFAAEGYIALENFPMEKIVAALDIASWDAASEGRWSEGHRLDTKLWFSGNPYREMSVLGDLRADGLPLKAPDNVQLPTGLRAQLAGRWQFGLGWHLSLHQTRIPWKNFSPPAVNLVFTGGANQPLRAAVDEIDLAAWYQVAEQAGLLQGKLGEVMTTLSPAGKLTNIQLERLPAESGEFRLRANMEAVSIQAYAGAPAIEAVDGYLDTTAQGGRVVVDSRNGFSMFYPEIFPQPMAYAQARGELRWSLREELQRVELSSGRLSLSGEEGEGRGYIHLVLPYGENPATPELTLLIGVRDGDARFHDKYIPFVIPDALYEWLQGSIKSGRVSHGGFLLHGSPVKERTSPLAVQLFGHVEQGELEFSPEWPALRNAEGDVLLDNRAFDADIREASIGNTHIGPTSVSVRQGAESPVVRVQGQAASDLGDAMDLLHESPISVYLGSALTNWRGRGRVTADVDLRVPVGQGIAGGDNQVRAQLHGAELTLPWLELTVSEITGPLTYTTAKGLNSEGLAVHVWGEKARVDLASLGKEGQQTELQVDVSGFAPIEDLAEWLTRPELSQFARGRMQVDGRVNIPLGGTPGKDTSIAVSSDLRGVELLLPEPYGKTADDIQPLDFRVSANQWQEYSLAYGDLLRLQFRMDEQLQAATLAFGRRFEPLQPGYIDVTGRVPHLDLRAWQSLLTQWPEAKSGGADKLAVDMLSRVNLTPRFGVLLEALQLDNMVLEQLELSGEHWKQRWHIDVRSPNVNGELMVFDDGRPLRIDLQSLKLPGDEKSPGTEDAGEQRDEAGFLEMVELSRLPAMDVATESLTAGDTDYGAWSFKLRPIEGGIALRDLHGAFMGMVLSGGQNQDPTAGAELVWLQSEQRNSTYFNGTFNSGNLAGVLRELGQARLLENESARFDLDLLWSGTPDAVDLQSLEGAIALDIRKGRFIRGAEAGNNPILRLLGLLNFDTLARRLRLDFSDLYKEGMAFDAVVGNLRFDHGKILVDEPLRVATPSSSLQFAGILDAETEQVDATLVATLPVTGNLAVAAAFLGGLPAAVGVYVVGHLFKEQVDKASSIRYRISGSWDDPSIRVNKIFESSTEAAQTNSLAPFNATFTPGVNGAAVEDAEAVRNPALYRNSMISDPTHRRPPQP